MNKSIRIKLENDLTWNIVQKHFLLEQCLQFPLVKE